MPIFARHVLGYESDGNLVVDVSPAEVAAGDQRNAQRTEKPWRHELEPADRRNLPFGICPILCEDWVEATISVHRDGRAKAHRGDTWDGLDPVQNFLLHVDHPLGVLHFRLRDGKAERLDFGRRSESGLDVSQSPKRTNHEARAD